MEIKFIGTGGAFDMDYGNSAAIVHCNGKNILVDCGHTVFPKLLKLNLIKDIDYILITHLHDDHVGSLSTLIFYCYFYLPNKKAKIIVPIKFQEELINFLNFSQKNVLNFASFEELPEYITPIDTYQKHYPEMQTYGYVFTENQKHFVYSGDLNDVSFLINELKTLNLDGKIILFQDISFNELAKSAHAYYKEVENYLTEYEIWGYHCNPNLKPQDCKIPLVIENPLFLYENSNY
jgi:ribonuclease BN (tRNA processing enzyme)